MEQNNDVFLNARWMVPPKPLPFGPLQERSNQWFRFRVGLDVEEADCRLAVAVDSKYWLYVNGRLVIREGGLKRGPTPDGGYYDLVDISSALKKGRNTIALILCYFNRAGFSHNDSGSPGLLIASDAGTFSTWKVSPHPAYFDAGYVRDAFRLSESSVGFDARKACDEWMRPGFDDSLWDVPEFKGAAGCAPWGVLEGRPFAQWFWDEEKEYAAVDERPGETGMRNFFCVLPGNIQFVPMLTVECEAGVRIDIESTLITNCLRQSYVTCAGCQSFEFPLWTSGEGVLYRIPHEVTVIRLGYRKTGFPAEWTALPAFNDKVLDLLAERAQRTLYVTMRDTFMDCPCRERGQWPGDMVLQLGQIPFCFGLDAQKLVKKGLRETLRWQRENGIIYGPVPEGNWRMELPVQMLAVISSYGIWTYYMHTADRETLAELYPFAKRYLDIWDFQTNGLVKYRPDEKGAIPKIVNGVSVGTWDWLDWGERIDAEPLQNLWMICGLDGVARMAEALGIDDDAARLRGKIESLKAAVNANYWNAEKRAYVSDGFEFAPDDRVQGMAILSGTADVSKYSGLIRWLENVQQASPYMEKYVLEALFKAGVGDVALNRMRVRYSAMLLSANTTLWELFHYDPGSTINHSWSGGPLTLLAEQVAGIQPLESGWKTCRIAPEPSGLSHFSAGAQTVYGRVWIDAEKAGDNWLVSIGVPDGMIAELDFSRLGSGEVPRKTGSGIWDFNVCSLEHPAVVQCLNEAGVKGRNGIYA